MTIKITNQMRLLRNKKGRVTVMKRKSRFFTFCTSLIPGAGQMYQGHMKRGLSIMLVFMLVAAVSIFTNIGEICFMLPVIWFYAFFDAMNKSSCTVDELRAMEDKPLISAELIKNIDNSRILSSKGSIILGVSVLLVGVIMLYRSIVVPVIDMLLPDFYYIAMKLPTVMIGVIIILVGIRIMRGSDENRASNKNQSEQ